MFIEKPRILKRSLKSLNRPLYDNSCSCFSKRFDLRRREEVVVVDLVISLGTGPIFVESGKQKCVTKSSCEAEIIALSNIVATVTVLWVNYG